MINKLLIIIIFQKSAFLTECLNCWCLEYYVWNPNLIIFCFKKLGQKN